MLGLTFLLERSWSSIFHYFGVTIPAFLSTSTLQGTAFFTPPPNWGGGVKLHFFTPPKLGGCNFTLFVAASACFLGRVHGGAPIVPEKNRESFPLSENVFWCWLGMLLLAEYWGVLK